MADVQYASNAKANAALTTGIIGTSLGALLNNGVLGNLFGNGNTDSGDRPVTRYEMGLIKDAFAKDTEIAALKAQIYADNKAAMIQGELSAQAVWNATEQGFSRSNHDRLDHLYRMTRLMIPKQNIDEA